MIVNPSSERSCAHCTVNMFKAVFEILYAGIGAGLKAGASPIDPSVEVLTVNYQHHIYLINKHGSLRD
jgi:hypothetical protein